MSVASKNPFALLDEDASRPASPSPAAPAKEAAPAPAPSTRGTQKSRGGPASRGGRYYQRGGKSAPRDKENGDAAAEDSEPKKRDGEGRGRGRGRGRGDRARGRGRQFDRHSATGKTDSEKKIHQGWGGDEPTSELNAEAGAATDAAAEKNEWTNSGEGDAWAAAAAETPADAAASGEKAEGRKPREPEEEDNTLTLDEYLKKKQSLDIVPKPEVRKVDDSDLKDAVIITKKDEDEDAYFVGKAKSTAPKPKAKKEEKIYIEIDARFERPSRGGRGRGERGGERAPRGGRGRGGRGRAANGNNSTPALNVADETAFPSLA
ncbi:hypothetical protein PYCCODRAFT_1458479 [Trametes coccinea BRFM310]|uniref:Hyaluronan/mRNA-binding protein domain-containing protein n=1 Tax=Trametes coccinea (strain BRFM310) TaxID=1353009 RepID=A0A1Y2IQT1_TRAC3|nr:hypothetical protein PYCCODRAFT_1458479 [Trametes coccinea BRFM310]